LRAGLVGCRSRWSSRSSRRFLLYHELIALAVDTSFPNPSHPQIR
jgi:hypothetical protein